MQNIINLKRLYRYIVKLSGGKEVRDFFKHYAGGLYKRLDEHHIFLYGGGLAFSLFVCIIPFVLIIFSILGSILEMASVEQQVITFIYTIIPYKEYAEHAQKILFSRIEEVIEYKAIAGYIGGFGLLFAASGLFSSMRTILNKIFAGTPDKHAVIGKLRDFGMVIIVILFVLMATIILPAINIIKNTAGQIRFLRFLQFSFVEHFLITFLSFLLIFLFFYVFYAFIPYAKLGSKIPALSAFWAAVLWELAKRLFEYYITHLATFNKIYGTYAFMVVLAFWIYYACILFILGAEIGQLYRERLALKKSYKSPLR
ncbi:MAG: YihY/virulence factor BrkB family protein [Bacteroidota bacterium]